MSEDDSSWRRKRIDCGVTFSITTTTRFSSSRLIALNWGRSLMRPTTRIFLKKFDKKSRIRKLNWKQCSLGSTSWDTARKRCFIILLKSHQVLNRRIRRDAAAISWLGCRGKLKFRLFRDHEEGTFTSIIKPIKYLSRKSFVLNKIANLKSKNWTFWLTKIFRT